MPPVLGIYFYFYFFRFVVVGKLTTDSETVANQNVQEKNYPQSTHHQNKNKNETDRQTDRQTDRDGA